MAGQIAKTSETATLRATLQATLHATVCVIKIDSKREIKKIVHRAQPVELETVVALDLLLDLVAAEVLRVDLHRFCRQQSRLPTVPGQFVRLIQLVIWWFSKMRRLLIS